MFASFIIVAHADTLIFERSCKMEIANQPRQSKQGVRCRDCDRISWTMMLFNVPLERAVKAMMNQVCAFCGSPNLLMGEGRSLSEDRAMRSNGGSPDFRAGRWLGEGETGQSSLTIAQFMLKTLSGQQLSLVDQPSAPRDCDDVRRCLLLLDRLPEWAPHMASICDVPGWEKLGPAWDGISRTFHEEAPDLKGRVPRTAALLEAAI